MFWKLTSFAGYWQVRMPEHVQEVTMFTCKCASIQFCAMPLGLRSTFALFPLMASRMFHDRDYVKLYLNDTFATSISLKNYVMHLY